MSHEDTKPSRRVSIAVPVDLHRKAKAALALEGLTFQELCEEPLVALLAAFAIGKDGAAEKTTARSKAGQAGGSDAPR
jgi:hypothetical protein